MFQDTWPLQLHDPPVPCDNPTTQQRRKMIARNFLHWYCSLFDQSPNFCHYKYWHWLLSPQCQNLWCCHQQNCFSKRNPCSWHYHHQHFVRSLLVDFTQERIDYYSSPHAPSLTSSQNTLSSSYTILSISQIAWYCDCKGLVVKACETIINYKKRKIIINMMVAMIINGGTLQPRLWEMWIFTSSWN